MLIRTLAVSRNQQEADRLQRILEAVPDLEATVLSSQPVDLDAYLVSERFSLVLWPSNAVDERIQNALNSSQDSNGEVPEIAVLLGDSTPDERARLMTNGFVGIVETQASDELLKASITHLVNRLQGQEALRIAVSDAEPDQRFFVGSSESAAMTKVLDIATRVARSDSSVLLLGETGTGKEWLARRLHSLGKRSSKAFLPVNCAAIPSELLESELFGHERGAFTGAHRARRGYFELAHRGTLLLDEVGEMPIALQAKLLRVLQDKAFRRVGAEASNQVDVRVIAATNCDPLQSIEAGTLRADLYYRLAVITISMPPLRDRRDDILPLFTSFLRTFTDQMGTAPLSLEPAAVDALKQYPWPGNVRELMNVAERTVILNDDTAIRPEDLLLAVGGTTSSGRISLARAAELTLAEARAVMMDDFEHGYLTTVLERANGHLGKAARRAGIDPKTLYGKMKAHGLNKSQFKTRASRTRAED